MRVALGASASTFLAPGSLLASEDANSPVGRPFQMLVLGDSVMWGQGLLHHQKYFQLVHSWLKEEVLGQSRKVNEPLVFAHSGARIFPEYGKNRDIVRENFSGETNLSNPSILFQALRAHDELTPAGGGTKTTVDLILVNGGINDFDVVSFVAPRLPDQQIAHVAEQFCNHGMSMLLRFLAETFPSAKIVVTGYYQLVSEHTDPNFIRKAVMSVLRFKPSESLFNLPFYNENRRVRDELARRSATWARESTNSLKTAVGRTNKYDQESSRPDGSSLMPRVLFVAAPFGPENAYGTDTVGTKRSFLWQLNEKGVPDDPLYDHRVELCRKDGKRGVDFEICKRAATFHPNQMGSSAFANAIKTEIGKVLPDGAWPQPARTSMRVSDPEKQQEEY